MMRLKQGWKNLWEDRERNRNGGNDIDSGGNIYPLIHAIYYVDTVEIVEIEKQYKQECV